MSVFSSRHFTFVGLGLLIALCACNRQQGGTPVTAPPPETPKATSPENPAAAPKQVTLEGIARDAKGGAVLVRDNEEPVYLEGLESWPVGVSGKRVTVSGELARKKLIPDPGGPGEPIRQGAVGDQLVLQRPTWKVSE